MTQLQFILDVVKKVQPASVKVEIEKDSLIVGKVHFNLKSEHFSLFTSQLDISISYDSITYIQYHYDDSLIIKTNDVRYVSIKL